ncbi:MAG TPA: CdaR family protein [Thermoanaerobaculia bacterium]
MNRWASNWSLKILSVFLAITLWLVVSAPRREPASERAFAAPLSLVRMPRDLVITTQVPDTVSVRLRGRGSDLRSLSSQNLEVTLDLSSAQAGDVTITLLPRAINVPPEIEVVSIDPNRVHFRVEPVRQKIVPIRPFLVGQATGYAVGDVTLTPDHARVSGPTSQIRNLSEVATERIIMTGRTDTFTQNVAVVSDSSLIRVIDPLMTEVTVPLTEEIGPTPPASSDTTATTEKKTKKKSP